MKFTKDQLNQRDELVTALSEKATELKAEVGMANEAIEAARGKVQNALDAYNETLTELAELRDEIVSSIGDFIDEKSDKWRDGDNGIAHGDWKDNIEGTDLNEVTIELPDEIAEPSTDHADEAKEWPTEPGV